MLPTGSRYQVRSLLRVVWLSLRVPTGSQADQEAPLPIRRVEVAHMAYRCTRCAGLNTEEIEQLPDDTRPIRAWCRSCCVVFKPEQPPRLIEPEPRRRKDTDG
jgi:hypothetical protein